MQFRTDLALETVAVCRDKLPLDAQKTEKRVGETVIHTLSLGEESAHVLQKAVGRYITAELPPLTDNDEQLETMAITIGNELAGLLPQQGTVLVVGLGNEAITPDAFGPRTAQMVLATRHIQGEFARSSGLTDLRSVAVCCTDVLGNTGVESVELAAALCARIRPVAVIAVDALAAGSVSRLGCTVQLTDTGISPGSGVGNNRPSLNRNTLGVPVIGFGVPTVVDAVTIARELTGTDGGERLTPGGRAMMVTPREVDLMIQRASRLAAMAINSALQPSYSPLNLITVAV